MGPYNIAISKGIFFVNKKKCYFLTYYKPSVFRSVATSLSCNILHISMIKLRCD